MGRLIRTVFANDGLLIGNNLVKDLTSVFVDPERGNLHLRDAAPGIVDEGVVLDEVIEDIDRESRAGRPDIGADELTR